MKFVTKRTNWPRITLQLGVLAFILILIFIPRLITYQPPDFEAYCPFGGLQALGSYLLSGSLSCTMTSSQIVMGILLLIGVILFSKLFCAFICPVGTVSEWLGKLGKRMKVRLTVTGIADKALRSLKYILLFVTLYFTFQSNELFCKKYDPYFGLATGFGADVVLLYAIAAIVVVVLGSVFIRLFWCKYLCPLGAISNIFKFTIFFVAVLGIYLILVLAAGMEISYVWPLAVACAGGYAIELAGQKSRFFPVAKITRSNETCTDCKLCSKKCPQAIDVASVESVKHVDCNLCGDCLLVCPVKNTLTINRKKSLKWSPVIVTVALVILGISLGSVWEIPTINQQWGEAEQIAKAGIFTRDGLKSIKCYGSSMAFANKMRDVEGIYGVATYVKRHGVKLYYDSALLDSAKIAELLFTPQRQPIRPLPKEAADVYAVNLKLDNFFDTFDFNYLSILLKQKTAAVGMLSEYACPVIVKIYFPEKVTDLDALVSAIESKTLTYNTTAGESTVKLGYKVAGQPEISSLTRREYLSLLFEPYGNTFNDRESYSGDVVKSLTFPLGENRALRSRFPYLVSHLSNDSGIVEFNTKLDSAFREVGEVIYIDTITNSGSILKALASDSLSVTYTDGTKGKMKSMFNFRFLDTLQVQKN